MAMDLSKKRKADENGSAFAATSPAYGDSVAISPNTLSPDDARRILEPFTKEQLLDILQPALFRHHEILEAARTVADADPAKRKLFVRGLGPETTTEKLRNLFSSFGELEEAIVIIDKSSGKSKGYGFVTFKHIDGAMLALKEPSKKIDGRMTVTQLAAAGISGSNAAAGGGVDVSLRKIYVGNIPFEISSEKLLEHFSAFGEIEEGPLGFDTQSGKPKGFAFFVYKNEEGARASLVDPIKTIDEHQVNCKLAVDGKKANPSAMNVGGVQGPPGNRLGGLPPGSIPGPMNPTSGVAGGYGGFSGVPQALAHQNANLNSSLPSSVGRGFGNPGPSPYTSASGGYGAGMGASSYGGSHYAGSGSGDYGGMSNSGSSMYRVPPTSMGVPSGGYSEGGNYGLSSAAFSTQLNQPSPAPRVPPGGMYQNMHHYY